MEIKIQQIIDEWECETCGPSWATGYLVTLPNGDILKFEPVAACYDSTEFELDYVYAQILQRLGYKVELS